MLSKGGNGIPNLAHILNQHVLLTRKKAVAARRRLSHDIAYQRLSDEDRDYLDWVLARCQDCPLLFSVPHGVLDSLGIASRAPRKNGKAGR